MGAPRLIRVRLEKIIRDARGQWLACDLGICSRLRRVTGPVPSWY